MTRLIDGSGDVVRQIESAVVQAAAEIRLLVHSDLRAEQLDDAVQRVVHDTQFVVRQHSNTLMQMIQQPDNVNESSYRVRYCMAAIATVVALTALYYYMKQRTAQSAYHIIA